MDKNFALCQVAIAPVRKEASDTSEIVTQLLFGDYVKVIEYGEPWIKIYFPADDYEGYMDFKQLHFVTEEIYTKGVKVEHFTVKSGLLKIQGPIGVQHIIFGSNLPFLQGNTFKLGDFECEVLEPLSDLNDSLVDTAKRYLNTPYLWGGKGILGIDCSGLTQMAAKVHNIYLPRDASEQVDVGELIHFDNRQEGDLMYFVNDKGSIHHVGILLNETEIIHASGHVRIDKYDHNGIFREDMDKYTHTYYNVKRIWRK